MEATKLTVCMHCGCFINPKFGEDSPAEHQDNEGTREEPRAPGDYDNVCDVCNYRDGLQGTKAFKP